MYRFHGGLICIQRLSRHITSSSFQLKKCCSKLPLWNRTTPFCLPICDVSQLSRNNLSVRKSQVLTNSTFCVRHLNSMADNRFIVGYAKLGTSGCKGCKTKIEKGSLRIGKVTVNPFGGDGDMKQWYHPSCIFNTFKRARATTKKIEEPDDMEDFSELRQESKDEINKLIKGGFSFLHFLQCQSLTTYLVFQFNDLQQLR